MTGGKKVTHHTKYPPGTKENPLSTEGVAGKTRDLMGPVLGVERTSKLIEALARLETISHVRELRSLISA